jgi:hypothetical protein
MTHCKCAFTDPDGTFVPGEACPIHPDVKPQREALTSNERSFFECFAKTQDYNIDWDAENENYFSVPTRIAWNAWQAHATVPVLTDSPVETKALRPIPSAWMRGVSSYVPGEPTEYDVEVVPDCDGPPDDGHRWTPLYQVAPDPIPVADCKHERADLKCRDCGLDLVGALRRPVEPSGFLPDAAASALTDACMILDVVKGEWAEAWSEWDEGVRERITRLLVAHHERRPVETSAPSPRFAGLVGEFRAPKAGDKCNHCGNTWIQAPYGGQGVYHECHIGPKQPLKVTEQPRLGAPHPPSCACWECCK